MNIYKVCILGNRNTIKEVILFGNAEEDEEANQDSSNFSKETNDIPRRISQQQIHKDDSIRVIKNKILNEFEFQKSYDEIYLFSTIKKTHNLEEIFEKVSKKKDYLEAPHFKQLCVNLGFNIENLKDKPRYFYEDLEKLYDSEKMGIHIFPIGKKWRLQENELFCANPFLVQPTSLEIERSSSNPLESFENQVLLNNFGGNFIGNTIFICFAEEVLQFIDENNLESRREELVSYYFPFLSIDQITTKELLEENRESLIKKTKKGINKKSFDLYQSIDLLYDIYKKKSSDLLYLDRGISSFFITLHPLYKVLLPLDSIFKSVHSTKQIPFIKYNPGFRRENIYRFYTEKITKYGTKIPFLPPKTIFKLMKGVGKGKQISFAIETDNGDIYIDFNGNGSIQITATKLKRPLLIIEIDEWLKDIINPILKTMNEFLEKSGYSIQQFESLRQSNIEILNISYVCSLKIEKEIDISKYRGVFGLIFDILDDDFHKGALFRFKRVENYQEMGAEDIFIAELHGKYQSNVEIVSAIAREYEMTEEQAILRLTEFIRDHDRGIINKSIRILESPGFLTEMRLHAYDDLFQIEMILDHSTIHPNIEYLDVFMIYIDSLLRITQDPKTTAVSKSSITSLLTKSGKIDKNIDKSQFENIISTTEHPHIDNLMFSGNMIDDELDDSIAFLEEEEDLPTGKKEGISESFGNLQEYQSVDIPEDEIENLDILEDYGIDSNDLMFAEYQEDSSPELEGGGPSKEDVAESEMTKKIDGMQLKNRNSNLFLTRLKKYDPVLFLDKDDGKYSSYSKLCAANRSRQPVVLSDEEKRRIDTQYPGGYTNAVQYGVKNKNWYICPRYWCLLNNTPLSEAQLKANPNACGGKIIPKSSDVVPKGHYIYEFNHHIQHQKNGKYVENNPGFIDSGSHPDGHCIPCCFKKEWSKLEEKAKQCGVSITGPKMKRAKSTSKSASASDSDSDSDSESDSDSDSEKKEDEGNDEKSQKVQKEKKMDYIYEIRRYPIPQDRMGFLPLSVAAFLQTDNSTSIDPNNTKYIKKGSKTFLRYGVENSATRSFIACIAEVYARKHIPQIPVPSINDMCKIIEKAITIDYFLKYHNGSLPAIFKPAVYDRDIDYNKYSDSVFIHTVERRNQAEDDFFHDTIAAYENFIQYIKNPDSYIDHTYLWDMVCMPNPNLFITGYNLAILKIKEVDMTDDIELLCPTNAYSSTLYDDNKDTIILIQHDEFYEPVFLVDYNIDNETIITTTFEDNINPEIPAIHYVLKIIKNSIRKYCSPQESLPSIYKFKRNLSANDMQKPLRDNGFKIKKQIINYKGKTIGFMISSDTIPHLYLPCAPSPRLDDIPIIYMDDPDLLNTYDRTRDFLFEVNGKTNGEILCKPVFKVIEDESIVGLLTETNQFIMVDDIKYVADDDGIEPIRDENFIIADKTLSIKNKEDKKRVNTIQKISLETQFYRTFRTVVRILLHQINHKDIKSQVLELINNPSMLYKDKLKNIEKNIRELCKKYVEFSLVIDDSILNEMGEIANCVLKDSQKPVKKDPQTCILQDNGYVILPENNLVTPRVANNKLYYSRIADEIIRYKRIQQFILYPKTYLNITDIEYQINDNEIIMLESLLTTDYFKNLEPYYTVDNSKITYDIANPIKSQKYTSEISAQMQEKFLYKEIDEVPIEEDKHECIDEVLKKVTGNASNLDGNIPWVKIFPKNAKEIVLQDAMKCSFYPILYVYHKINNRHLSIEDLKKTLLTQYSIFIKLGFSKKILEILSKQGKAEYVDKINKNKYTLQDCVITPRYFMTNLDMWILANELKLPIVLFSAYKNGLKSFEGLDKWIRLYSPEKSSVFYFIRTKQDMPKEDLSKEEEVTKGISLYNIITPELNITIPDEKRIHNIHIEDYFRGYY